MRNFYNVPITVKFNDFDYEEDEDSYKRKIAGIAYHDKIICGCRGGVFEIKDLIELNKIFDLDFEELPWIDISELIIGD